jgi:lysophospholipase
MSRTSHSSYVSRDFSITSSDGKSQLFIRQFGAQRPNLHFILVHGALEHSGRHLDLIHTLLKHFGPKETAITVYDHLGHGRSGGVRAWVESFNDYVNDLGVVGNFIQSSNSETTKTIILAHSLGGLVSLTRILDTSYGWNHPLHGIIFSSPCIRPKLVLGSSSEYLLERFAKFSTKLHLPMIYKGSDLTRDPERANDFQIDTLIPNFITVGMAREILQASNRIRGLSYYVNVPSLFLIAGDDKIVDSQSTRLFAHGIDKSLVKVIDFPQHRHELWNEIDRFEIFKTMIKWSEEILKVDK